jgi:uncharacterized protein DUF4339
MADERKIVSWYIARNGSMFGPLTYNQLAAAVARNEVDYVWRDGLSDWEPASRALSQGQVQSSDESPYGHAEQRAITYSFIEGKSVKFATIIWILAGLLIPLWPVSLPICWYLAYRSYKRPMCRTFELGSS